MDALGYVYNRAAATLREKRRRLIGVVVTNFDNAFLAQSLHAIEVELNTLGYSAVIASSLGIAERQEQALQSMRESAVSAVILAAVEGTGAIASRALEAAGIACVSYTRLYESADYVGPDDVAGGRLAARHLLEHGVDDLVFIGSGRGASASRLRQEGIEREIAEVGTRARLTVLKAPDHGGLLDGGHSAGREMLDRGPLPQGVLCMNDATALGAIRAFHEAGVRRLPRIIGFDDIDYARYSIPSLTTVSSHPYETGRLAAHRAVERAEGRRPGPEIHFTEPQLVVRESCGCASAGND